MFEKSHATRKDKVDAEIFFNSSKHVGKNALKSSQPMRMEKTKSRRHSADSGHAGTQLAPQAHPGPPTLRRHSPTGAGRTKAGTRKNTSRTQKKTAATQKKHRKHKDYADSRRHSADTRRQSADTLPTPLGRHTGGTTGFSLVNTLKYPNFLNIFS